MYDQVFLYLLVFSVLDWNPGNIEVLTDLLAEDWAKLGSVKEMGEKTQRFFREELEKTWGSKHLAVLSEEEAKNWLLGVSVLNIISRSTSSSRTEVVVINRPRVRFSF